MEPPYNVSIDQPGADSGEPDRRKLADWSRTEIVGIGAVAAVLLILVTGVVWVLVKLVTGIGGLLADGGRAATSGGRDLAGWLTDGPITTTVTTPVRAYLDTHAAGLPATAGQLWTTWLVAAGVLLLLAATGSLGARIGWTVLGALTTAMVYAGTTGHGQALAAGLTAAVWALLSIPAFARRHRGGGTEIIVITPAPRETSTDNSDTEPAHTA